MQIEKVEPRFGKKGYWRLRCNGDFAGKLIIVHEHSVFASSYKHGEDSEHNYKEFLSITKAVDYLAEEYRKSGVAQRMIAQASDNYNRNEIGKAVAKAMPWALPNEDRRMWEPAVIRN